MLLTSVRYCWWIVNRVLFEISIREIKFHYRRDGPIYLIPTTPGPGRPTMAKAETEAYIATNEPLSRTPSKASVWMLPGHNCIYSSNIMFEVLLANEIITNDLLLVVARIQLTPRILKLWSVQNIPRLTGILADVSRWKPLYEISTKKLHMSFLLECYRGAEGSRICLRRTSFSFCLDIRRFRWAKNRWVAVVSSSQPDVGQRWAFYMWNSIRAGIYVYCTLRIALSNDSDNRLRRTHLVQHWLRWAYNRYPTILCPPKRLMSKQKLKKFSSNIS